MTDASGSTNYAYDKRGNLTIKTVTIDNIPSTFEFDYNGADQLTNIIYPSGREIEYTYNTINQISAVTLTEEGVTSTLASNISYAPFGPMISLDYGNGINKAQQYDLDYRLTNNTQGSVINQSYGYDEANNIKTLTNNLNANNSQTLDYDGLSRLIDADGQYGNKVFSYDDVGNRTNVTSGAQSDTYNYVPNTHRLDQITGSNTAQYSYDNNGNITNHPESNFTYGAHNRISSADTSTYTYNGNGERVKKEGTSTTYFDYGPGGALLAERDDTGDSIKEYIFLNGTLLAQLSGADNPPVNVNVDDIIVDNSDSNTTSQGNWQSSGSSPTYLNTSRGSDWLNGNGYFKWIPNVATAGTYKVSVWFTYNSSRPSAAEYVIHHAGGNTSVTVAQNDPALGGHFTELTGTYTFNAGSSGYIQLNSNTTGNFSVDAIKLEYVGGGNPPPPNAEPVVTISSPVANSSVTSGTNVTFTATATDAEDGNVGASLVWTSDKDGQIGTNGSFSTSSLSENTHLITATATDSGNSTDTDNITITVTGTGGGGNVTDIIVDNSDSNTESQGNWQSSGSSPTYLNTSRGSDWLNGNGYFKWISNVATAGTYKVSVWFTHNSSRPSAAEYVIHHAGGNTSVTVAQNDPALGGHFTELTGTYTFNAGSGGYIQLNSNTTGNFSADAIKLEYVGGGNPPPPNTEPVVTISSPVANSSVTSGTNVTFTATATDAEDGNVGASLVWTSDKDGQIGTNGSFSTSSLSENTHLITATATDSGNSTDTDNITITVTGTGGGGNVTDIIVDNSDSNTTSQGNWQSSGSSPTYLNTSRGSDWLNGNGHFKWTPTVVTTGTYKVSVWFTHNSSRPSAAEYVIHHAGGNTSVTVAQNDPALGGHFTELTGTYTFNTGSGGYIQLNSNTTGNFSADAIKLEYVGGGNPPPPNAEPVVTISSPVANSSVTSGTNVTFTATATDAEDGNVGASLVWTSDKDGQIGTNGSFSTSSLSENTHLITATATDSGNSTDTDNITITVTGTGGGGNVTDIIVDNSDSNTTSQGNWQSSGSSPTYLNTSRGSDWLNGNGHFKWTPTVVTTGTYKVSVWFTHNSSRPSAAEYVIHHAGGNTSVTVAQNDPALGGHFTELTGTYTFNTGSGGYIQLNSNTTGNFSADAIKLEYVGGGN